MSHDLYIYRKNFSSMTVIILIQDECMVTVINVSKKEKEENVAIYLFKNTQTYDKINVQLIIKHNIDFYYREWDGALLVKNNVMNSNLPLSLRIKVY